jgi:hypothetical protein
VVVGNPARINGYVGKNQPVQISVDTSKKTEQHVIAGKAMLLPLTQAEDMRGSLAAIEFTSQCPFTPKRLFIVHSVPNKSVRGEHAHYQCKQFLIAASGSITVSVDDGTNRGSVTLNNSNWGLYIPELTWGCQFGFSDDAVLIVLASDEYQDGDYIRDYEKFLKILQSTENK